MNFVNNNITGGGKLVVTFVNVFGSWIGDFITPGNHKNNNTNDNPAIGGLPSQDQPANNSNNIQQESSQNSSSGNNNSGSISTVVVATNNPITNTVRVLAVATGSFSGFKFGGTNNNEKTNSSVNTASAKKITFNLAWGIFALPLLIALYIARKRLLFFKRHKYS